MSKKKSTPSTPLTASNNTAGDKQATVQHSPEMPQKQSLPYLLMAALGILVFIAYNGAFDNIFVDWDDYTYIVDNRDITKPTWATLWGNWTKMFFLNYHPLTMSSYWLNAYVWGAGSATSFIVTNVLLHVLNTGLVFALVQQWSKGKIWVSFFTALLFGIHPVHVESVAWVSERKDVLYTFFFLSSLYAYWHYISSKRWAYLGLTWCLFLLSCLSKAMAVVLPIVLWLIDYWRDRPFNKAQIWLEKIPFLLLSLLFGSIAISIQSGSDMGGLFEQAIVNEKAVADANVFSLAQRFLIASYGLVMYIVHFFAPVGLCTYYPYPDNNIIPNWFFIFAIAAALLLASIAFAFYKQYKAYVFGLSFYIVTVALVLQFMSVGVVIIADRYAYLPYIGLAFALLMGLEKLTQQKPTLKTPIITALALFSAVCLFLTIKQVATWQNTETLFNHVLKFYPKSDHAYATIGNYLGKKGKIDEAMGYLEKAAALGSKRGDVYEGLGNAYGSKNQPEKAIEYYNKGIELEPQKWGLYYNRGIAKLIMNQPAEAIPDFTKTLAIAPAKKIEVLTSRGRAYINTGNYADALRDLDELIQAGQQSPDAYLLRGIAKHGNKDLSGAANDYKKALQLNPNLQEAKDKLQLIEKF
jgi:Tfp pilus assembly protein PilF